MMSFMRKLDRSFLAVLGILLSLVLLLSVNVIVDALLTRARVDLTEDHLFTLSDGTEEVLSELNEPITLRFYLSQALLDGNPYYASHAQRVRELLESYRDRAGGNIRLEIYDPQAFSPEEDQAAADGLSGVQLGGPGGDSVYFGLAGYNATDDHDTIAFFSPDRAAFLEYELTRLVNNLAHPEKAVVGFMGDLPLMGDQTTGFQPWMILRGIEEFFDSRRIPDTGQPIPDEIDVLVVSQPETVSPGGLYAIDQFVLRGGRALVVLDPFSEAMTILRQGQPAPVSAIGLFSPLLTAWGVSMDPTQVVADRVTARRVSAQINGRQVVTDYVGWMQVQQAGMNQSDIITANLELLNINSAGSIQALAGATTSLEPIVQSSADSMMIPVDAVFNQPDPVRLLADFVPDDQRHTLIARISGPASSAFADGPPEGFAGDAAAHLSQAVDGINVILLADGDFLSNPVWTRADSVYGQQIAVPTANNGDFIINALDNLAGSAGLISLRGRGVSQRPFDLLLDIQRDAERRYRAEEVALTDRISQAEDDIRQLREQEQQAGQLLTQEQDDTIEALRQDLLQSRQQLREVQHALRQEIEAVMSKVRIINIAAVPLAICVIAVMLALLRRMRVRQQIAARG